MEVAAAEHIEGGMFVGGAWDGAPTAARRPVTSPATGETIGHVLLGTAEDVDRAVRAAAGAKRSWAARSPHDRGHLLARVIEHVDARRWDLARLLSLEQGKVLQRDAVPEVDGVIRCFEESIAAAKALEGTIPFSEDPSKRVFLRRVPVGVVAAIQPWNYPLSIAASHVAPALASGNAVVMLPAPSTSLVAMAFAECISDADLPDGVFNFITGLGSDIGDRLTGHAGVQAVAFTGSSATGLRVARQAAGKAVLLELGGNGPTVVLDDADLELAARELLSAGFDGAGQGCTAAEHVLVHRSVAEELAARLAAGAREYVLGDPLASETRLGPLNNGATAQKMDDHVEDAVALGATVLAGGERARDFPTDLYWPATVLSGVTGAMAVAREETFGPILPLQIIDSEEEAHDIIDRSPYGLASAVFTRDLLRGMRFAERVETGTVAVNVASTWAERHVPFGGRAGKTSGQGRNYGKYPIEDVFTELKAVFVNFGSAA